jgi:DNA polymerase-3 subunit epsilon
MRNATQKLIASHLGEDAMEPDVEIGRQRARSAPDVDRRRVRLVNLISLALPFDGAAAGNGARSAERLARWRAMPEADLESAPEAARFVVVDVASSGPDSNVDHLREIGAVTVERARIHLGRSFHATVGEPESSGSDHPPAGGTGAARQGDSLLAFLEFAGKAPLVGYDAGFRGAMIRKAALAHLGETLRRPWIDLAEIAPRLLPEEPRRRSLRGWLDRFGIEVFSPCDVVANALATAQLLLAVLARAEPRRVNELVWRPGRARWLGARPTPLRVESGFGV